MLPTYSSEIRPINGSSHLEESDAILNSQELHEILVSFCCLPYSRNQGKVHTFLAMESANVSPPRRLQARRGAKQSVFQRHLIHLLLKDVRYHYASCSVCVP